MFAFKNRSFIFLFPMIFLQISCNSRGNEKINVKIDGNNFQIDYIFNNKSGSRLYIPSREYFEYNQKDNSLYIKTFTDKERKGDFSHTDDVQYLEYKKKELNISYGIEVDNFFAVPKDSNVTYDDFITEVNPNESVVLFFHYNISNIDISKLDCIIIEWLSYNLVNNQKKEIRLEKIEIQKELFNKKTFNTNDFLPIWETETICVSDTNIKECFKEKFIPPN